MPKMFYNIGQRLLISQRRQIPFSPNGQKLFSNKSNMVRKQQSKDIPYYVLHYLLEGLSYFKVANKCEISDNILPKGHRRISDTSNMVNKFEKTLYYAFLNLLDGLSQFMIPNKCEVSGSFFTNGAKPIRDKSNMVGNLVIRNTLCCVCQVLLEWRS